MEIEAKFVLPDPEIGRRLQATNQLAGFTLSSNEIKHQHDIYLDTRERLIFAAGYSCRYREQDDGVLMTVKPLRTAESAIHRRQDVEVLIPAIQVSVETAKSIAEWPSTVRDHILPIIGDKPLAPLVDLNQTRVVRRVKKNGRLVAEMSHDEVCADTAERHFTFLELEVELMPQGTEDDLAQIAAALQREWKLRPERRSKFERVLAFLQEPASSAGLLTFREREICLQIAAQDLSYRRRAKALLALDEGATAEQAAECAGFSVRRARYWEKMFREKRLGIFPNRLIEQMEVEPSGPAEATLVQMVEALPTPVPPSPQPGLTRHESMAEAARKTIQFHFRQMLKHEAGTRAGEEIEELHDMRVATRRMRAALGVFEDDIDREAWQPFAKLLRRTGRALGKVRDLDVFREKMQHYLDQLADARQTELEPLLAAWETGHGAAREELLTYLDSEAYARFKVEFGDFLEIPGAGARPHVSKEGEPLRHRVLQVLPIILYQGLAEVCAYDEGITGVDAPLTRYHQLRIASKRLRYTLEFFKEVLSPEAEMLITKMKTLQDHLGNLQDAVVACEVLRNFLIWGTWGHGKGAKSFPAAELVIAPGVAAYLTARQTEIQDLKNTFAPVWAEVQCEEFRRQLGALVIAL